MIRPLTVAFYRSPPDFPNFSMDRYAESLSAALHEELGDSVAIEEVRPPAPTAFHRSLGRALGPRVYGYWRRYVSCLAASARDGRFAVSHVLDHGYAHLAFALDPARTVVSCHDIFPLKHWWGEVPSLDARKTPPLTVKLSLRGLKRARYVVTPSAATKADLVARLRLPEKRVRVVPYGVDRQFRRLSEAEREELRKRLPLGGPDARHVLVVDTGPPYKNQRAMVEVLVRVRAQSSLDVRLVHVGPGLPAAELDHARRLGVEQFVIQLGPVDREQMPAVYNCSDVLLFPSFYEGFGWPPLEAMACGVPVVCSRAPSVLEVVGDAAMTADAEDHDALADDIFALLADGALAERASARGLQRARRFKWPDAAADVAELYRSILDEVSV